MTRYYLLLFLLIACGRDHEGPNKPEHVDPELAGYVDEFMAACEEHAAPCELRGLTIKLEAVPEVPNPAGFCSTRNSLVRIPPDSDTRKWRVFVFHELGHCALYKRHAPAGSGAIMEETIGVFPPAEWGYRVAELMAD